jgi:hypothetical protein
LRIGQLIDSYKPAISGVIHSVSLHKKVLESWGHDAYVFTVGNEEYEDDKPNVIRSPAVPLSDTGYYLSFRYSRQARRLAESHSLSVLEGLAAGLSALGIPSPGIEETIQDGINGLLVEDDVDGFAQRMALLAEDAGLRARLAGGGQRSPPKPVATRYPHHLRPARGPLRTAGGRPQPETS